MKLERLSENQIRCTLSSADLNEKQLKISELAYGSPKARALFRDMMQQASVELGFEADDTPLMIEAIPMSPDCLVMIVTKVEDPEELDTRFSRFSHTGEFDTEDDDDASDFDDEFDDMDYIDSADDEAGDDGSDLRGAVARVEITGSGNVTEGFREALEGLFNTLSGLTGQTAGVTAEGSGSREQAAQAANSQDAAAGSQSGGLKALFTFDSLPTIITAAKQVAAFYFSDNCLYKNPSDDRFYLLLTDSSSTRKEFARVCSILGEYGTSQKLTYAMPAHFKEHFKLVIADDAVQTLSAI